MNTSQLQSGLRKGRIHGFRKKKIIMTPENSLGRGEVGNNAPNMDFEGEDVITMRSKRLVRGDRTGVNMIVEEEKTELNRVNVFEGHGVTTGGSNKFKVINLIDNMKMEVYEEPKNNSLPLRAGALGPSDPKELKASF